MKSLEMRADRNQKGGTESLGGFDKRSDEAVSSHHQTQSTGFRRGSTDLPYGIQGLNAVLAGKNFVENNNYYESIAKTKYWW